MHISVAASSQTVRQALARQFLPAASFASRAGIIGVSSRAEALMAAIRRGELNQ